MERVKQGRLLPIPSTAVQPEHKLGDLDSLLRTGALESLSTFCETFNARYTAYKVHRVLCAVLELVEEGVLKRVCISCPPRTGKSTTTTVKFPAYALSRNPAREIIQGGFSSKLSTEFSVKTKALLNSERYRHLIGNVIAPEQNRQEDWKTVAGGEYYATSVGGSPVGRGGDLVLIDDVLSDRADANSGNRRKEIWKWFLSAIFTRLSPQASVLIIGTRWHRDDLIGKLTSPTYNQDMRDEGFEDEQWFEVNIQAICENAENDVLGRAVGESYWTERWTVKKLRARERVLGVNEFQSQYQGKPRAEGTSECDTSKVKVIDASQLPEGLKVPRAWDLALGVNESNDWSCGAKGALDKDGNFFLVHMDRKKRRWLDQKQSIVNYAKRESTVDSGGTGRIGVEGVAAWQVAIDELRVALSGSVQVLSYSPTKDKLTRASPWLAIVDEGKFHIVRGPWNALFVAELEDFPNGTHDDQIDAVTILYEMVRRRGNTCIA